MEENIGKYVVCVINNSPKGIFVGLQGQIIGISETEENAYRVNFDIHSGLNMIKTLVKNKHFVILKDMFSKKDLELMYNCGQSDCGEFGRVRGFEDMFEEMKYLKKI